MEDEQAKINAQIERIGFGKFQIITLSILWLRYFSYSSTSSLVAILEPYLRCKWNLSYMTAAWVMLPEGIVKIAGSVLIGILSDKYGRRRMMILAAFFNSYLTLLFSLSSSVILLSIIRGSIGLVSSASLIAFTYAMEILPISKRKYMSIFEVGFFAGCGYGIIAAMISLKYLTWRWFDAISETIPIAISGFAVIFLPESPRFLATAGQNDAANAALDRIAKMNGFDNGCTAFPDSRDENNVKVTVLKGHSWKYENIKRIAQVSFLQFYGDIISATVRFGSMQFGENSDDSSCGECSSNLTYTYRWAVEVGCLISAPASYLLLKKVARKRTMQILVTFLAAFLVPYYWPLRGWPLVVTVTLTVAVSSTLNNVLLVYRAELLPTTIRASGCGISDAAGQFGILFGQFIAMYLYHYSNTLSFGILHGFTAFGMFLAYVCVVETKNAFLN